MPFVLRLDVDGDVQLERSFSRFSDDVKDFSEPFREIAKDFTEVERKQFESEGRYGSGGWKPLSPEYAAWKAENYPGRPILVLSGLLKESLEGDNPWAIRQISATEMTLGTRLSYARYHQKSTSKMSARPVIDLTESDKKRWVKIIQRWLVRQMNKEFA